MENKKDNCIQWTGEKEKQFNFYGYFSDIYINIVINGEQYLTFFQTNLNLLCFLFNAYTCQVLEEVIRMRRQGRRMKKRGEKKRHIR